MAGKRETYVRLMTKRKRRCKPTWDICPEGRFHLHLQYKKPQRAQRYTEKEKNSVLLYVLCGEKCLPTGKKSLKNKKEPFCARSVVIRG